MREPSLADAVTHAEMQAELARVRLALKVITAQLVDWHVLDPALAQRVLTLLAAPGERSG